jgi:predicted TIM-barrel fold metal-dependent hydrolase
MTMTMDDMSARYADDKMKAAAKKIPQYIVSSDDHVYEPAELWDGLPQNLRSQIARPPSDAELDEKLRPRGGRHPKARLPDMDLDGISACVLYPSFALRLFNKPQDVQEAAFTAYNDWIADYCKAAPKRLFAIPCISAYNIDQGIKEMQRCADMGLLGSLIWQVPDPKLPLISEHYEKLWAAAAELGQPVHLHILTGFNYNSSGPERRGMEKIRGSVNIKTADSFTCLYDMIWSGVFNRHPKLKVAIVEAEIGWIPFMLQQWDYYYKRNTKPGHPNEDFVIKRLPSEIFNEHVYATFMDDFVGAQALKFWGDRNCMWSSDYPHPNMTWPNSRAFLGNQIGDLDPEKQKRVLSQNCIDLYKLKNRL